jgi:thiaminase (transcriptional activator TenA)
VPPGSRIVPDGMPSGFKRRAYQGLAREAAAALDEQFARRGDERRFPALAATFATAARLEADFWQMGLEAQS